MVIQSPGSIRAASLHCGFAIVATALSGWEVVARSPDGDVGSALGDVGCSSSSRLRLGAGGGPTLRHGGPDRHRGASNVTAHSGADTVWRALASACECKGGSKECNNPRR